MSYQPLVLLALDRNAIIGLEVLTNTWSDTYPDALLRVISLGVEHDGLPRLVLKEDCQLDKVAAIDSCRNQLLGLIYEFAVLNESYPHWHLSHLIQILIEDD